MVLNFLQLLASVKPPRAKIRDNEKWNTKRRHVVSVESKLYSRTMHVVLNYEPVDDILKCKFEVNTLWEN